MGVASVEELDIDALEFREVLPLERAPLLPGDEKRERIGHDADSGRLFVLNAGWPKLFVNNS